MDDFSRGWRFYFFVCEFFSVPVMLLALLGGAEDAINLRVAHAAAAGSGAGNASPDGIPLPMRLANAMVGFALFGMALCIVVGLWTAAANLTAACDTVRSRGMEAISAAAAMNAPESDLQRERARGFVTYAELKSPGFSCHGITISFNLAMILAYPLVTGILTLGLPFATTFLQ